MIRKCTAVFVLQLCIVAYCSLQAQSAGQGNLFYPGLVKAYYERTGGRLSWFGADPQYQEKRALLLRLSDSAFYYGLTDRKYSHSVSSGEAVISETDSVLIRRLDERFTDIAIALFTDLQQGVGLSSWLGFDAVGEKFETADQAVLLSALEKAGTAAELAVAIERMEPGTAEYKTLKTELIRQVRAGHTDTVKRLKLAVSYYRRIHHHAFTQVIVVNLAAARLYYYEQENRVLDMKTVVGKFSTPTPRFSAFCDQAVLYPYWYVPSSIIFKEYLPIIRNNPGWLDAKNMQVIDGSGKVLNHHQLNWSAFHNGYFPYWIRQSTGCDNALGVIKFNINTPYGVYLHDTNNKSAFRSGNRYLSHGCIRLEKPFQLGYHLLGHELDTAFLRQCFKKQQPVYEKLPAPIPVFVVYMPVEVDDNGKLVYYKDSYRLIR